MPEWAEAVFVLAATVLVVVAYRVGAAARRSPEGGVTLAGAGRGLILLGVAAGSTGAGTFAAGRGSGGSLPALGWILLMVAALALTSGFALRLGAGWGRGAPVSPARRLARFTLAAAIAVAGAFVGNESFEADEPERVEEGRAADLFRSPAGTEPAYSFVRPARWTIVTESLGEGNEGVVEVALLPPDVPAASLTVTRLNPVGDVRLTSGELTRSFEEVLHGEVAGSRPIRVGAEPAVLHETRAPGGFRGRGAIVVRDGRAFVVGLTARAVDWVEVAPALDGVLESWEWEPSG